MKIKICHFVNLITGKTDGVYAHLKMIFRYVNHEKFQQYLVFQGNPEIEEEITKLGVKVYIMKSLNKKYSIKSFKDFYSFVKSENIDIIQTHFLKPYAISGIVNIFLRRRMIFNYHGLFIDNLYNNKIEIILYKIFHLLINLSNSVNIAIVPSHRSKELLLKETKLFPNIRVYYNGYDSFVSEQPATQLINYFLELKKSKIIIGMVARIDIQKRIDIALKIIKRITQVRNDINFLILGDGALQDEIAHLIYSMNLKDKVNMLGYIPNAKIYIKYFDLLLFTSDWEGFPLSIWDAMAAGVPIVSTDVGGIKEILENEICGITFKKGDVVGGSEIILELLSDRESMKKMSENGKNAVINKYSKEAFAEFFNHIYAELGVKNINS